MASDSRDKVLVKEREQRPLSAEKTECDINH